jgi:hypothetical protein
LSCNQQMKQKQVSCQSTSFEVQSTDGAEPSLPFGARRISCRYQVQIFFPEHVLELVFISEATCLMESSCCMQHDHLFVSNLGDSRIIMGSQGEDGKMVATQISVDLKPDLPGKAMHALCYEHPVLRFFHQTSAANLHRPTRRNTDVSSLSTVSHHRKRCVACFVPITLTLRHFGFTFVGWLFWRRIVGRLV